MRAIRATRAATALAAAALVISSAGCAVLGFDQVGHEGGEATLGQAASAATDSTHSSPPLDVGWTTPPEGPQVSVDVAGGASPEELAPATEKKAPVSPFRRPVFGLVMDLGAFGGDSYDGFGGIGLSAGGYPAERLRLDLFLRAGGVDFQGQSLQGQAFKNTADFKLELMARYELTPGWTALSLYPVVGLGTGTMFWDYASPVPIYEDGGYRYVSDDHINHFYGYGGLGFALLRTNHVLLDVIGTAGVRFYGWHTYNGFSNDLLPTVGFAQLQLGVAFR